VPDGDLLSAASDGNMGDGYRIRADAPGGPTMTDPLLEAAGRLIEELERETGCRLFRVERVRIARCLREAEGIGYERGLSAAAAVRRPTSWAAETAAPRVAA
jgi:hypothetical protein